jgi:hypothetical protein
MVNLDRVTARALVEAGYMPLARYIELFGSTSTPRVDSPSIAEDDHTRGDEEHERIHP